MSELQALQHAFWSSIKQRRTEPGCMELVREDGKISPDQRVDIYRTTMREAHVRALATTYSSCEKILGNRYFKQLAIRYYYGNPASHPDLNRYGESFPDFVQDFIGTHQELAEYPYLPDLARLEWLYAQAWYAKEDPAFDFERLATLDENEYRTLRFVLGAPVATLKSAYPIDELWKAQQEPETVREIEGIDEPRCLCIARENYTPTLCRIDYTRWWVMDKLDQGCTFGELEALLLKEPMEIPLQSILPELIARQWICGYQVIC